MPLEWRYSNASTTQATRKRAVESSKKPLCRKIIWERRHSGFVAFPVGSEEVARHAQAGREARATWAWGGREVGAQRASATWAWGGREAGARRVRVTWARGRREADPREPETATRQARYCPQKPAILHMKHFTWSEHFSYLPVPQYSPQLSTQTNFQQHIDVLAILEGSI